MTRVLSLREFAKRERANSWQSKGKLAFKFVDCHAVFVKTARNDGGFCHFEPFAKRRKIQRIKFIDTSLCSVWQGFCHFEWVKRTKNPQNLRYTLILWILRFLAKAQYDNVKSVRYGKTRQVSMTKSYAVLFNPNFNFLVFERKNS